MPVPSLITMSCGVDASWLSKWIVNATFPGAETSVWVHAMLSAVMFTTLLPVDGAAEAAAEAAADGAAEAPADAPADADGPAVGDGVGGA